MVLLMTLTPLFSMGQSHTSFGERPSWVDGYFKDVRNSYIEVVSAFDYNVDNAKQKAINNIARNRANAVGAVASFDDAGNISVGKGQDLIVKARIIDEYIHVTSKGCTVYLLVQTAKNPTYQYENVSFTSDYSVGGRAFLPGAAQIYKGHKAKGYSIIAAQALSVAGIIFCESERSNYISKMKEQPKFAKDYKTKADNWETGRNICIGAAAAVYIYNVIDAFVSKGEKKIKVRDNGFAFNPYVEPTSTGFATGISLAYRF